MWKGTTNDNNNGLIWVAHYGLLEKQECTKGLFAAAARWFIVEFKMGMGQNCSSNSNFDANNDHNLGSAWGQKNIAGHHEFP